MTVICSSSKTIPVALPYLGAEEEQLLLKTLRSGWLTQGPAVSAFEEKFAAYIGCEHAVAVSSCTTALYLALLVTGLGPGDEVLCPSLSFIATANSITYTGATPVFADVGLATYNLDPNRLEEFITPRCRAILVVHQIGLPADMRGILQFAAKHQLRVIEDAACAIGSEYERVMVGSSPERLACFSFHPRKILTTGEGGMITTGDAKIAARLRKLRQHAMSASDIVRHRAQKATAETYDEVGFNFRMTDMQAAIGIAQLERIAELLHRRRYLATRYTQAFGDLRWLKAPEEPSQCRHNYQSYMVRLIGGAATERNTMMQLLLDRGISTRRGIMAIHREAPYRTETWEARLPQTNRATDTCMILPLFHQLGESDQDYIIEAVRQLGG